MPVIFWLWFFLSQDKAEPEPRKLLVKIFLLGICAFFLAMAIEATLFSIIFLSQFQDILLQNILQRELKKSFFVTFTLTNAVMFFLAGLIEEF
jgi:RsiW-degrading membrane proteinase PrsW (M82 family)